MKLIMAKHFGSLRPANAMAEERLAKIKHQSLVEIEIKRRRNIKFNNKYWVLVHTVWHNIDQQRYPTPEILHSAIKIAVGLRTDVVLPNGEHGFIPGSIAFDKMDADTFSEFYDRVCHLVATYFIPGLDSDALKREVEELIGAAA